MLRHTTIGPREVPGPLQASGVMCSRIRRVTRLPSIGVFYIALLPRVAGVPVVSRGCRPGLPAVSMIGAHLLNAIAPRVVRWQLYVWSAW